MEFQDKTLACVDCGAEFIWTAGEQLFFADKNFKNEPKRCKSCKAKRASRPASSGPSASRERVERPRTVQHAGKKRPCPSVRHRGGRCSAGNAFSNVSSPGRAASSPELVGEVLEKATIARGLFRSTEPGHSTLGFR